MILEQLTLHNFGLYRDRHVVDLAPPSRQRPVILFGGLNGGGKTTLLDALQLVLYGQFAQCSNRGDLSYEEFLRRSIHRGADPHDGAAIELAFSHISEGKERSFRIRRAFWLREKNVRERLEVHCDGAFSQLLTDAWAEQIEELIPVRLSKFFFFDGEKIESLADLDRSAEVLSTAVHSLLGLDLVDQLVTDLVVLERRKKTEQKQDAEREALERANQEIARLDARRKELFEDKGSAQIAVDRAQKRLRDAEERFKLGGGDAFERRKEVEAKKKQVKERWEAIQKELEEQSAASAPLLLVADLLADVTAADEAERAGTQAQDVHDLLANRDRRILDTAEKSGATKQVLQALADFLASDRRKFAASEAASAYLHLSAEGREDLVNVRASLRGDLPGRLEKMLAEADRVCQELDELDRKLASVPDQEAIAALAAERVAAQEELAQAELTLKAIQTEHERVNREHGQKWEAYARMMNKNVDAQMEQEAVARIVTHSEQIRQAMKRFRVSVVERHTSRIQQLILESFQHLLRKESLVSKLSIDPAKFSMTLFGADGRELSPERLSAGERQLLAISTIWGITRAAGRPLPVVIDTPLGRLDSVHRKHLVERYFPHASHQVLLLSTDKEIDEAYYEKLKPSVGRAYTLKFDDRTGSTSVQPGYFWS